MISLINDCLKTVNFNTIRNLIRVKKIKKSDTLKKNQFNDEKNKKNDIEDRESLRLRDILKERDYYIDEQSSYGNSDIGLKLTRDEFQYLFGKTNNPHFFLHNPFEVRVLRLNGEFRKFCTIAKIIK